MRWALKPASSLLAISASYPAHLLCRPTASGDSPAASFPACSFIGALPAGPSPEIEMAHFASSSTATPEPRVEMVHFEPSSPSRDFGIEMAHFSASGPLLPAVARASLAGL